MNNNKELGTVLVTSSESATSATTISNKRAFITKYWTLAVIAILMSAVIALSSVLIVKLNSDATIPPLHDDPTTNVMQDFEDMVVKYADHFAINENGVVKFNIKDDRHLGTTPIEAEDLDILQEYIHMLDGIDELVQDGKMALAEDGNYYVVDQNQNDGNIKGLSGGKNNFYVRTKKIRIIFFDIPVPIGYHISFGSIGAILFGAITAVIAWGPGFITGGKSQWLSNMRRFFGGATWLAFMENANWIYDILFAIYVTGLTIEVATAISAPGIGSIVVAILKILAIVLASYIWNTIGMTFLFHGLNNIFSQANTVYMETDMILQNKNFWTGVA